MKAVFLSCSLGFIQVSPNLMYVHISSFFLFKQALTDRASRGLSLMPGFRPSRQDGSGISKVTIFRSGFSYLGWQCKKRAIANWRATCTVRATYEPDSRVGHARSGPFTGSTWSHRQQVIMETFEQLIMETFLLCIAYSKEPSNILCVCTSTLDTSGS